jgi:hypothetical protein
MRFDLTFYPLVCVALILLALLFYRFWQGDKRFPAGLKPPRRKRESKPFVGLSRKPDCEVCEQQICSQPHVPSANHVIITWLFVTFGDSGSRKQNCHERGEGGELENPCESMEQGALLSRLAEPSPGIHQK